jgi:hypothetical protein
MVNSSIRLNTPAGTTPTSVTATLTTDLQFETSSGTPNSVPITCPAIMDRAQKLGSKQSFLNTFKIGGTPTNDIKLNLTTFKASLAQANQTQQITDTEYAAMNTYLSTLENSQLPVIALVSGCLAEIDNPNTQSLIDSEKEYEESKSRYESITSESGKVSYYQGWFPIFRPMKQASLFILFGVSLFILIFSILLLLRLTGIEINIIFPTIMISSAYANYDTYKPYLLGGGGLGILIVIVGVYLGWF